MGFNQSPTLAAMLLLGARHRSRMSDELRYLCALVEAEALRPTGQPDHANDERGRPQGPNHPK